MNDMEYKDIVEWVNTRRATTQALLELINDLAPIIGYNEAQRLVNIIGAAQKGDTVQHNETD